MAVSWRKMNGYLLTNWDDPPSRVVGCRVCFCGAEKLEISSCLQLQLLEKPYRAGGPPDPVRSRGP